MCKKLMATLREKKTLLKAEDLLLIEAKNLYEKGFSPGNLSKAQMAAITERLRRADSLASAKREATDFLRKQIKKLSEKSDRTGKKTSWIKDAARMEGEKSLGQLLIGWLEKEAYLHAGSSPDLNRLYAMRLVWSFVCGMYGYRKVMEKDMPILLTD